MNVTNSTDQIASGPGGNMFANQRKVRIFVTGIMLVLVVILGFQLHAKLDYVAGCHDRFAQLERIEAQTTTNEAAIDIREKALEAAEARLSGKQ